MRKCEDAVIHMNRDDVIYLAGEPIKEVHPLPPYDARVCTFLDDLSVRLRNNREALAWPDIASFAFFCRRANLNRMKAEFEDARVHIGRGLAFHIAPSNVPINCLYTYVFGLLAGNANVVRASSKDFEQVRVVCRCMEDMFSSGQYENVRRMTAIVMYGHERAVNDDFSARADIRVIWGGNRTIDEIRKSPIPPRGIELTFADRYSFAVIDPQELLLCDEARLERLAGQFYNDTYLMDQNACSTPHLVVWLTQDKDTAKAGQERFWKAVFENAKKYDLAEIKVCDKYVQMCELAATMDNITGIWRYENLLYVMDMNKLPKDISLLRGKFGLFFQYTAESMDELAGRITNTVQTCVYYGIDKERLQKFVIENGLKGIDRIVSIGQALNIGVYWDGYDIIRQMSRVVV